MTPLTARERDVLALLVCGLSNKQIAAELRLSAHTVAHIVEVIRHKLDAANRAEAAAIGVRAGLA